MNRGRGAQTANYYLREIKSFCVWLVHDRRTPDNPLDHLQALAATNDRRRDRRPLTLEELRAVVDAAMQSSTVFRGLGGRDRAILYAVAVASGFRASELASLRADSFELDTDPPTATLAGEQAKNGKMAIQPLPPDLVAPLRCFLKDKSVDRPIWPGSWPERAAEMFRADLQTAGIAYVVDGPNGDLFSDFHSLRHSFVALLDQSGASLKQAMQLARHSDPKLTMARYGRAQLYDLGEAVRRLPSLFSDPEKESEVCRATGTDGDCAVDRALTTPMRIPGRSMRIVENTSPTRSQNTHGRNPLEIQRVEADCDSMRSIDKTSGGWDRTTDTRLMKPFSF
jgi:integrase